MSIRARRTSGPGSATPSLRRTRVDRVRKSAMRGRENTRGMTLLEAVFAVLVLSTGVVAVFGMISRINSANRTMAFQTGSLDAFAQLSAQIRDAKCYYPAETPGWASAVYDAGFNTLSAWVDAPSGSLTHVGYLDNAGRFNAAPTGNDRLHVAYFVTQEAPATPTTAPSFNIDIEVRQIMHDARMDALTNHNGYWIQTFPVKKMCSPRADSTARGEY